MDIVAHFIDAVESRVDDLETKKSFIGFAKDAQEDPVKMQALTRFIDSYTRSDGTFDPIMYSNPSYVLMDMYDDILSAKE